MGATYFHAQIPWPIELALGGWLVAWHGSLQHEIIHGHPTRWGWVNTLIAAWPLCLWLPFEVYRRSHRAHHAAEHLTLPGHDPETRYLDAGVGLGARLCHRLEAMAATLAGRLVLGPAVTVFRFLAGEALAIRRRPGRLILWLPHLALAALVLGWLVVICRIRLLEYLLLFVYPGMSLTLLRSFAEHRADADPAGRIAVVERAPVLGLLFLNNNLHLVHHSRPGAAWYHLPAIYRGMRSEVLKAGGPVYRGYGAIMAQHLFRPHDRLIHPAFDGSQAR